MKLFIGLMTLAMSFATIASTGESKTFIYDGTRPSVELILRGEKTHTEYRYENRPSTCYRQEIVGYRTVCNGGGPRPSPRPSNCYRTPIYRQVAYTCMQTIQIPYEVKDYDVEARMIIDVTKLSEVATPGEQFKVTLFGDDLSVTANGSKKFIIVQKKLDIRSNISGNVKFMDGLMAVELVEAAPVLETLKLSGITLKRPTLNYNLGPIVNRSALGFSLSAVKNRRLSSDVTLFNRELNPSEIELSPTQTGTQASINIANLDIRTADSKITFTAKAFFKTDGAVLNKSQFENGLEAKKVLTYDSRN